MALSPGARLGPYEIVAPIGAGGMGEVYRAHDARLKRDVAIKVLPAALSNDAERLQRFEQEAQAAGSLHHPNILAIYDVGTHGGAPYIVSELLEGETVRSACAHASLGTHRVLELALQVAQGLAAAHEKGIVHRDLKPENLFLTRDGLIKILDFGLAKLTRDPVADATDPAGVPTVAVATQPWVVLGTVGYMSPEQVSGMPADHRADIFAFGAILYEMLAGCRAFTGESPAATMSAILRDAPPDLIATRSGIHPRLDRIVRRCLEKRPEDRFQSARDLGFALTDATLEGGVSPRLSRAQALPWIAAALAAVVATGIALQRWWPGVRQPSAPATSAPSVDRFVEVLPAGMVLAPAPALALSSDGRRLAYVGIRSGARLLYVRQFDEATVRPLPGTEGADQPFFSPDGRWIGFFAEAKLKKVPVAGGAPIVLCDASQPRGGSWAPDNTIVFSPAPTSVLLRVSAEGGSPQPVTTLDRTLNEASHRWPFVLPDGDTVIFGGGPTVSARAWNEAHLVAQSIRTGVRKVVAPHGTFPQFTRSGHLVYMQDGVVFAQRFNPARLEVTGDAVPVGQLVTQAGGINGGAFALALSTSGTLAYVAGTTAGTQGLVWVDRRGVEERLSIPVAEYRHPRVSSDGRRVAVSVATATGSDVWVYDISRGTSTRFTTGDRNLWPVWTPDATRIAYASSREGSTNVFWKRADGSGTEEQLTSTSYTYYPHSFLRDGSMLTLTEVTPQGGVSVAILPLIGQRNPSTFWRPGAQGLFSPDGRWVAYVANESGRSEVYVRPFPGPGAATQISTDGGDEPVWAPSGRELFFRRGDALMAVGVGVAGGSLTVDQPQELFSASYLAGGVRAGYDVSPDGQRFVLVKASQARLDLTRFNLVVNWLDEMTARLPSR